MNEDQLTAAYLLATSDVESEQLCDEGTFVSMFRDRTFTWMERERIGSEAWAIRGDESWDWIVPGITVEFYANNIYGRQVGVIESLQIDRVNGCVFPYALIRKPNSRRLFWVEFGRIRKPRN